MTRGATIPKGSNKLFAVDRTSFEKRPIRQINLENKGISNQVPAYTKATLSRQITLVKIYAFEIIVQIICWEEFQNLKVV
ncbi:hypothetical protein DPMN_119701 [Dreissena polymorpha]|uniref:Uncharacterized protein n=1 Tax=Dreissena polymorpha TaxID=45954 RepID=A0A9D4JN01_DREPO|nr:hypothetical protein DPMN_119701 [Dreissena polymorpha]